ncbi:MAG: FkbM family methyltransferase [Bryobacteraceae bacterium]|jgi:FkbM family methyltransferase
MPAHHPIFSHFKPLRIELPSGFGFDLLGTRTRSQFVAGLTTYEAGPKMTGEPLIDEEYFEWIDLLESVVAAKGSYTMIDLGAGYGRWVIRAAFAMNQYHSGMPYRLIAVEAEPVVYQWMHLHFNDNGIDPSKHSLIHGAVCDVPEDVLFYIGGPRGGPYDRSPDDWYGQFLTKSYDVTGEYVDDGEYSGFKVRLHKSGWRSISIPGVTLESLLKDLELVDLIDMDIEGQELPLVRSGIEELNTKVKRLHIGTHGKEIEAELRQVLSSQGWNCLADYSVFSSSETPWGVISFENGVQSWVNPRLS